MRWINWFPMRYILRRAARSQGFLDPLEILARLRSFAQPSEIGEPVELLRAGMVFHARGLINSRLIQYNLDWVWPYWVQRQYDPRDISFIPRAFSFSHINLTHRNWTAIGYPDCDSYPIIDPRGLLTPILDSWSLDAWVLGEDGEPLLLPSQEADCAQALDLSDGLAVITRTAREGVELEVRAEVEAGNGVPVCTLTVTARSDRPGWLVLALRPCNPEGVSFIHTTVYSHDKHTWTVNGEQTITFTAPPARMLLSDYDKGDVFLNPSQTVQETQAVCDKGLVTAAAFFPMTPGTPARMSATINLPDTAGAGDSGTAWRDNRAQACKLTCPDDHYTFLFEAAVTSLVLHSPGDVYPGPYTYRRFWFRDAAFIIDALLCLGLHERAERAIAKFPERQTPLGYFRSQEGEWDSNGEVLWLVQRYLRLTGNRLPPDWHRPLKQGARWIMHKRLNDDIDALHAGLMPAGFSAEHLGPNDHYYWDAFWSLAGLRTAADMMGDVDPGMAESCVEEALKLGIAIDRSLETCALRLRRTAAPASPHRRLDAGAIGSLAAGYPLQMWEADDPRLLDTVEFLLEHCFVQGAFFQDMIHSGMNAYLTLHVAQVLLRAGDPRYLQLMDAVAALASPTGQWPEAIHPLTGGGCMGDGHHVWASAEWVLMLRNCFVREEGSHLILCAGIPERWLQAGSPVSFGPAPTAFGPITITLLPIACMAVEFRWEIQWHEHEHGIEIRLPGYNPATAEPGGNTLILHKAKKVVQ